MTIIVNDQMDNKAEEMEMSTEDYLNTFINMCQEIKSKAECPICLWTEWETRMTFQEELPRELIERMNIIQDEFQQYLFIEEPAEKKLKIE